MTLRNLRTLCALVTTLGIAFGFANLSFAEVVGGLVTGGNSGGVFELLPTAPAIAGPDQFQSPNLIAFDEKQDVVLPELLAVGANPPIAAGRVVSSHYVVFDPELGSSVIGFVDFDEPILAVLADGQAIADTTSALGIDTTTYTFAPALGFETGNSDIAVIASGNPNRLLIQSAAISPGDHVRVLTGVIPIPEPHGVVLVGLALILGFSLTQQRRERVPRF